VSAQAIAFVVVERVAVGVPEIQPRAVNRLAKLVVHGPFEVIGSPVVSGSRRFDRSGNRGFQ